MNPTIFRRDRWLRTSAYHLATWSIAAFVFEVRFRSAGQTDEATGIATAVVIVAASLLSSMTTERRIGKMFGPAGEPAFAGAGRMWRMVFATLASATAALVFASRAEAVLTLWLLGVGTGFLFWGRRIGFAWYAGVGLAMIAAGILDSCLAATGGPVALVRMLVLGLALPVTAVVTNRRFLWLRAES